MFKILVHVCSFIFLTVAAVNACLAQEMSGRVLDAKGQSGIAWVKVTNSDSGKFSYTNHEGKFEAFVETGDTLVFSLKNYYSKTKILHRIPEEPLVVYLEFDAVELPEVYVMEKNENTTIQLHGIPQVDPDHVPIRPGHLETGATEDYNPSVSMAGPISFFSKSEKHKRKYREAEEMRGAQEGYLEVIHSDSMRNELKAHFSLTRERYDSLLILFNAANRHHQFRDMDKERVEKMLFYFMNDAAKE